MIGSQFLVSLIHQILLASKELFVRCFLCLRQFLHFHRAHRPAELFDCIHKLRKLLRHFGLAHFLPSCEALLVSLMLFQQPNNHGLVLAISFAHHLGDFNTFRFGVVPEVFVKLHEASTSSHDWTLFFK